MVASYTTKDGVSPSFEDIVRHFGTAPPNANGMKKRSAAEVSRRVSAEGARWGRDGAQHRRGRREGLPR